MCPKISPGASLPVLQPRVGRAVSAAREPCRIAWEARPKPGSAFPANMSKQGLSARLYASNQTLIMVKAELLQCGGSEVLFDLTARLLRVLLSKNHTRIMYSKCPFGFEVRFLWLPRGQRTSHA